MHLSANRDGIIAKCLLHLEPKHVFKNYIPLCMTNMFPLSKKDQNEILAKGD